MVGAIGLQRSHERRGDVILADEVCEPARTVRAVQGQGHGAKRSREQGRKRRKPGPLQAQRPVPQDWALFQSSQPERKRPALRLLKSLRNLNDRSPSIPTGFCESGDGGI